jgi:hypothetical protein
MTAMNEYNTSETYFEWALPYRGNGYVVINKQNSSKEFKLNGAPGATFSLYFHQNKITRSFSIDVKLNSNDGGEPIKLDVKLWFKEENSVRTESFRSKFRPYSSNSLVFQKKITIFAKLATNVNLSPAMIVRRKSGLGPNFFVMNWSSVVNS